MPHFVIDCSENILNLHNPEETLLSVHKAAVKTGLFGDADIKVRFNSYSKHYLVGGQKNDFIHVFANIMEGRTTEQKASLSKEVITQLKSLFPSIDFIAINIRDFEKSTYCNKSMV